MSGKWSTSSAIRGRVLDAALTAFEERGYSDASMADIAEASDVSIGSIYHHFGGKEGLFDACFYRLRDRVREIARIRPDVERLPHGEWEVTYLRSVRAHCDASMVFLGPDTPPNFEVNRKVAEYFHDLDPNLARILAAVMTEAARILCRCPSAEVGQIIDATVKLLSTIRAVGFAE